MANEIINIDDSKKDWELLGAVESWEELFMNDQNFLPIIEFCKDKARNLVADVHTKEGVIARKSLAKQIGRVRKAIEDKGMEVARALKEKPKIVDATRKRVKDTLDMYKDEVLKPLKEIEAREALCAELAELPKQALGCGSVVIGQIIEDLQARAHLDSNLYPDATWWQETHGLAVDTYNAAFAALDAAFNEAAQRERDAAELVRLREQQAAQAQAAEKAKREAEAKAQAEQRAKEEAERRAAEAEARAKAAEEAAARMKAQQEAHDREMAEAAAKTKEEQKALRNKAKAAFMELLSIDEDTAKKVVTAIHKGEIPGVKMDY